MSRSLLVSVHDVSPKYSSELSKIFEALDSMRVREKDLLVVLNWECDYPVEKDSSFLRSVRNEVGKGADLMAHGITHYGDERKLFEKLLFGREYSAVGEFKPRLSLDAGKHIKKMTQYFQRVFHKKPMSFCPARWELSSEALEYCRKSGIRFTESSSSIYNIATNAKKFSLVCCFDYGDNRLLNLMARPLAYIFIGLARLTRTPLRYSIHPNDVNNGNFDFELKLLSSLIKSGWQPITTKKYWEGKNASS